MAPTTKQNNQKVTISFDDTATAFRYKTDRELLLSWFIFSLTKSPFLVKFLSQAAKKALDLGLPIKKIIKSTVFKQFCGGENRKEYLQVIEKLGRSQIGTILDYSVEGGNNEESFERTKDELIKIINEAQSNENIPCTCMKMTAIGAVSLFEAVTSGAVLSENKTRAFQRIRDRLDMICHAARLSGKPIYIDAEESWVQGAMDRLAEEMMAKYNRGKAVVFTTLQLYRWDRIDYFSRLITKAGKDGYILGVKFVRGAYLEKERERAARMGYPSPVNDTKQKTDDLYNTAIKMFIENIDRVELCLGTHNEYSCKLLAGYMAEKNIPNNHPHIYFSQLYGMSDNISFNLAKAGYNVSKYLPFGPVEATLPYLARRAEENTAIAGQMGKELEAIVKERRRRKTVGQQSCR
ncbi:MAG: proline dehydrogenase [Deltaproteobacteria bacterium]|nr:MAG: proline dehydrogenase [Deltaproteobacteria bacterium]